MVKQSTLYRSRLLLESGSLGHDPVLRCSGAHDVVLSRALCRFRHYRPPRKLSGAQFARAARLYAEAHAPFENSGALVVRSASGAGIWYWDQSKLSAIKPIRQVSPETVWRAAGEGWRIVACVEGFEAQYWEGGDLLASTWRRQPFTQGQWTAFAISVEAPAMAPLPEPPEPLMLRDADGSWRARAVKAPLGWRDVEIAGVSVAICAAAVAALLTGQALRSDQVARREQAQVVRIEESLREDLAIARAMDRQRLLQDYQEATRSAPVIVAAAEAHEALARFGLRANTWRASSEGLSFIVEVSASSAPVREVVAALEQAPHLCGALPEIAGAGTVELRAGIAATDDDCAPQTVRRR